MEYIVGLYIRKKIMSRMDNKKKDFWCLHNMRRRRRRREEKEKRRDSLGNGVVN